MPSIFSISSCVASEAAWRKLCPIPAASHGKAIEIKAYSCQITEKKKTRKGWYAQIRTRFTWCKDSQPSGRNTKYYGMLILTCCSMLTLLHCGGLLILQFFQSSTPFNPLTWLHFLHPAWSTVSGQVTTWIAFTWGKPFSWLDQRRKNWKMTEKCCAKLDLGESLRFYHYLPK